MIMLHHAMHHSWNNTRLSPLALASPLASPLAYRILPPVSYSPLLAIDPDVLWNSAQALILLGLTYLMQSDRGDDRMRPRQPALPWLPLLPLLFPFGMPCGFPFLAPIQLQSSALRSCVAGSR